MKITHKKSEIILNWLTKSDIQEIAGILGYSWRYVRYVLKGERSYTSPGGEEIMRLAIRKARSNKYMRQSFRKPSKVA